jgi:transcriptional regulator with XRE-family HTH domain
VGELTAAEQALPAATIAARIDRLFRVFTKPDGREYSHREVEREAFARWGERVSHAYIGQLRSGQQGNPTVKPLRLLARFFGVPVSYFLGDDVVEVETALLAAPLRERPELAALVETARPLSAGSLTELTLLAGHLARIEHSQRVEAAC